MTAGRRIPLALFLLRLDIFPVMLMWTLDKFVNPQHAVRAFEKFYPIGGLRRPAFDAVGGVESVADACRPLRALLPEGFGRQIDRCGEVAKRLCGERKVETPCDHG